ncbi:hypothetical protein [Faecalicatena orotica]|uniref:hypothetical protein n=1 Tax=Faecalicatena orotica TaxID=1544 RepID=UPI0032163C23
MAHRRKRGVTISKKALIAIIIAILLLIIGGVLIGLNWNRWFGGNPFTPDVDPNAGAWQGQQLPNKSGEEAVGIQIPGYPSITIPADTKNVTVAFLNPEDNPCYFTFELVLKDTDEVLYTSKMVPPGQAIYEAELSRPLEKGEYNATIKIKTASLEDGSAMNGADVETVLIVQ